MISIIRNFFKGVSLHFLSSVIILLLSITSIALCTQNIQFYNDLVNMQVCKIPLKSFVNEVLMCLFFFLVGLELKKECVDGVFKEKKYVLDSFVAAFGGMLFPALIYFFINFKNPSLYVGSAIPCATDIAFSIAIFNLYARFVFKNVVKVFLLTLCVFDDIGAMILVALCYTKNIRYEYIPLIVIGAFILFILNKKQVQSIIYYHFALVFLWLGFFYTGLHPTLAGVILGLSIPYQQKANSMFNRQFNLLNLCINFIVLPIFAFFACDIDLSQIDFYSLFSPHILGIVCGLFFGKQIGIVGFIKLFVRKK